MAYGINRALGVGERIGGALTSDLGTLWTNQMTRREYAREFGRYRRDVMMDMARAEGALGYSEGMIGDAGRLAGGIQEQSDRWYDPQAARSRFDAGYNRPNQLLRETGRDLGAMPTRFNQATGRILEGYGQRVEDVGGGYARGSSAIGAGYGGLGAGLQTGYGQRTSDVMGLIEGMGGQERADINRQYDEQAAAQRANLSARGLGGTTTVGTAGAAMERERTGAQGRLGERLRREQAGYLSGLSGEALAARERVGTAGLGARERMLGYGAGLQFDLTGQELGAQEYARDQRTAMELGRAGMQMGVAGQQADIAGQRLGYQEDAMGQRLGNQLALGQLPLQYGQDWVSNVRGYYGPLNRVPPRPYQPAQYAQR